MGNAEDKTPTTQIEVDEIRITDAVGSIMDHCQTKGFSELESYIAMIHITNTMEETLGFGYKRNLQA